jgi:hypothetical protein
MENLSKTLAKNDLSVAEFYNGKRVFVTGGEISKEKLKLNLISYYISLSRRHGFSRKSDCGEAAPLVSGHR